MPNLVRRCVYTLHFVAASIVGGLLLPVVSAAALGVALVDDLVGLMTRVRAELADAQRALASGADAPILPSPHVASTEGARA
jgi:hypothetical protein